MKGSLKPRILEENGVFSIVRMMKYLRIASILLLVPVFSFAETRLIISEGSYNMGDGETPTVAESRALLNAKRTALEQAGTYVESYSRTKNYELTEDEVKVIASGLMQVTILEKKRTIVGDGFRFWVKIEAMVNPEKMENMAARVKEKFVVEDYRRIQKEYEKSRKEIAVLKKRLRTARNKKDKKNIEALIESDERSFQANEWFEKGSIYNLNYEHDRAIESYTSAIALSPNYAEAYERRGIAYYNKGLHQDDKQLMDRAVEDFKRVTILKPDTHAAFWAQGIVDFSSNQYLKALESFSKAVAFDPESELGYLGRGVTYAAMKQFDRAVEEYTRAIEAKGFWQAVSYQNRAVAYGQKGQYELAIRDMDQAIALVPNNAHFYYLRGLAYALAEDMDKADADLDKACKMGYKKGCEWLQKLLKAEKVVGSYYLTGQDGKILEFTPRITFAIEDGRLTASSPPQSFFGGTSYKTISDIAFKNNALTFKLKTVANEFWNVTYVVTDFTGDTARIPVRMKQLSGNIGGGSREVPGLLIRDEGQGAQEVQRVQDTSEDCFIATAAFGSPFAERVTTMRIFRDKWLMENPLGRAFVGFYYRNSPTLAGFIQERPWARMITCILLYPITILAGTILLQPLDILQLYLLLFLLGLLCLWRLKTFANSKQRMG